MDNLILSMLVVYNKYGDDLFLGFNKNNIDNFIKKYNYLDNINCNERGYIILWKNKYISDKDFGESMKVEIKDNKLYIVCNGFDDILSDKYSTEIDILNGEIQDHWQHSDYYDYDISNYWSDYNEETIKTIYDFCIKNGLEIDDDTMTEHNTKIENDDILFNGISLEKYIDSEEGLKELKKELNNAILQAYDIANQDATYDTVKSKFINDIGDYHWVDDELYIEIDKKLIDEAEDFLIEQYGESDFESQDYGSLFSILTEMEMFVFKAPNYDYISERIDNDVLNEHSQENLQWAMK